MSTATAPVPAASTKSAKVRSRCARFLSEIRSLHRSEGASLVADYLEHEADQGLCSLTVPKVIGAIRSIGPLQAQAIISGASLLRDPHARRVRELHQVERKRLAYEVRRACG